MFIRGQLAAYAHGEAAHAGGFECMLAVACIIRNRQRAGWYSGNWMQILNAASDVSAFVTPSIAPGIDLSSAMFRRVLQDVDDIYNGTFDDELTGRSQQHKDGALYYVNTVDSRPIREWFQDKIIRDPDNHPRIAQVGPFLLFA